MELVCSLINFFQGCLSARSGSLDEISGSIYTLLVTNLAMVITTFILGFQEFPEITLQEYISSNSSGYTEIDTSRAAL